MDLAETLRKCTSEIGISPRPFANLDLKLAFCRPICKCHCYPNNWLGFMHEPTLHFMFCFDSSIFKRSANVRRANNLQWASYWNCEIWSPACTINFNEEREKSFENQFLLLGLLRKPFNVTDGRTLKWFFCKQCKDNFPEFVQSVKAKCRFEVRLCVDHK